MTSAGAAGECEKYLAPPIRPEPSEYPPAVRFKVPPVILGLRVEAKGARPGDWLTRVPILDDGKDDLSYLTPRVPLATLLEKWRTADLMPRWVENHRD